MAGGRGAVALEMLSEGKALEITPFVRRFRWVESLIRGGFSWEIAFETEQWPEWERILVGRDTPEIQFRLRSDEGDGLDVTEQTTGWRTAIVDTSAGRIKGESLIARIWGADRRLELAQVARIHAWPASTVSDIVTAVAGSYGLDTRVEATRGVADRIQARQSDWSYLLRLSRQAASESGRGDLFLHMDENTLVLGAPDIARPSDRLHDLSEVENRVDSVEIRYAGRGVDRIGGATVVGVGYDFDAQAPLVFKLDAGAASSYPALASRVPRAQEGGLRSVPMFQVGAGPVAEGVRGIWGRAAPRYFQMRLATRPDLTLRPGNVVEVQATQDERRASPFFGRFAVLELEHLLTRGGVTTTAACYRREAFQGAEDTTGASVQDVGSVDQDRFGQPNYATTHPRVEVLD